MLEVRRESVSMPNRCADNLGSTSASGSRERTTLDNGIHFGGFWRRRANETRVVVFENKRGGLQTSARRISRLLEMLFGAPHPQRPSPREESAAYFGMHAQFFAHQGERGPRFRATAQAFRLGCSESLVA